jgi:hypothetical protein
VGVPRFFGMHVGAVVLEVDEPGTPGHYFGVAQTANGGDTWSVAPTPAETASIGASPATAATVLSASTWVLGTHEGVIETPTAVISGGPYSTAALTAVWLRQTSCRSPRFSTVGHWSPTIAGRSRQVPARVVRSWALPMAVPIGVS